MGKNNLEEIEGAIKNKKTVAMLAPSFVSEFDYPDIVIALRKLGFSKVAELTFGAKMVNREYHEILKSKQLWISTACPGVAEFIRKEYPNYVKNLVPVDSPMIATAKICRKEFPDHKIIFISPCHFKKKEAESSEHVDFVIDYQQLRNLLQKNKIKIVVAKKRKYQIFDSFYNDYTKIYPIAGGLSKTARFDGIITKRETLIIDGVAKVKKCLDKGISPRIRFLDVNFCNGGCLGGPCLNKKISGFRKRRRLKKYLNYSKRASIGKENFGGINHAEGISFRK